MWSATPPAFCPFGQWFWTVRGLWFSGMESCVGFEFQIWVASVGWRDSSTSKSNTNPQNSMSTR